MATETLVKLPHEDRKSIAFKCMCIGQRNILAKRYANLIAKGLSYKTGQITQLLYQHCLIATVEECYNCQTIFS